MIVKKALRYYRNHGLRKTMARSFLELSRILDREVEHPRLSHHATDSAIEPCCMDLPCTGERVIPTAKNDCFYAHLSIYNFAKELVRHKVVLDAGCGSGYGTYYLATHGAKDVCGIDIGEEAISFARGNYRAQNLKYMQMDCEKIDLNRQFFDVVFSSNMIEHLDNYRLFLNGVRRVLKRKGIFILATPPLYGSEPLEDNPFHHTNLQVDEWIDILSGYFNNIETYRHLFKTGKKHKNGAPYVLDFSNSPEDCNIDEEDFYFERVPDSLYRNRIETITALFLCSGKR
jgi:2-polyprenyl-3-methyl-5-hydroxy-6-metoxy-1,4-benzoquinol methylase